MPQLGLGRVPSNSDERDFDFTLTTELERRGIEEVGEGTKLWDIPYVYDQGPTPRCVAFSGAGFLTALAAERNPGTIDVFDAGAIYAWANANDGLPEPHDGSTVRAAFQAVKHVGSKVTSSNRDDLSHNFDLSTYLWASPVDDDDPHLAEVKTWLLKIGPLWVGTEWAATMFSPDPTGLVVPQGSVAGGHAYLLRGYDSTSELFVGRSTWGNSFGGTVSVGSDGHLVYNAGAPASDFLIRASDVAGLLSNGGECGTCLPSDVVVA